MHPRWSSSIKTLCAVVALAALLAVAAPRAAQAQAVPWWDPTYTTNGSARQVTVTAGAKAIPAGSLVSLTFNHGALSALPNPTSTTSGNDVRLAYRSGGVLTEIGRALATGSSWNAPDTKLMFKTQAPLLSSGSDSNYFLYYSPVAGTPLTNVPVARTFKAEQVAEVSTGSTAFVNVPGTTLTFTPGDTGETWVIFASGSLRSNDNKVTTSEMRLLVGGVEVDYWGQRNRSGTAPNGSGFLIFHRITNASGLQSVQLQFRAGSGTTFASNVRVVAVLMPQGSDFQLQETAAPVTYPKDTLGQSLQTMTILPPTPGDYFIFGKVSHTDPGGGTVQSWVEDEALGAHPNAPGGVHYSNPSNTQVEMTVGFKRFLSGSGTFTLRGTAGGKNGSTWTYRRLMAFRADAFEKQEYIQQLLPLVTTGSSTAYQPVTSLQTELPPAPRDYLVVQLERLSGPSDQALQKSGELRDGGAVVMRTDHRIDADGSDQGEHTVVGVANVKTTSAQVIYENGFQSSDGTKPVECAESTIMAMRYLELASVTMRPLVRDVKSTVNGVYGLGPTVIPIQVRFSEVVHVTGTPLLTLETGGADAVLSYVPGPDSNTLTFNYVVLAGHTSADLDVFGTGALALSGGTIRNLAGVDADIVLPAPGTLGSLSTNNNLVIDGIVPTTPGTPSGSPNPNNSGNFTVSWAASTDSGGAETGTVKYTLERSSDNGSTWPTSFPNLSTTSLAQAGLAAGTYLYRVTANDLALNVSLVSAVSAGVVVDKTAPLISSITSTNSSPTNLTSVTYTVTFNEPVNNGVPGDFSVVMGGGVGGASVTSVTGSGATRTVTVNTGTGQGSVRLAPIAAPNISDPAGNLLAGPFPLGTTINIDKIAPTFTSIVLVGPAITNATSVDFTVTFSESVIGVDSGDFTLPNGTGASIFSITGTGATRTVTVNTGNGDGTIQLNLADNDSITDPAGNPLGGLGGATFAGPTVTIDKSVPVVQSIVLVGPNPTNAAAVNYTVTFSESVTGVGTADFTVTSGLVGPGVSGVSGTGTTYTVTVNTGSGSGSIVLNLVDDDSIIDGVGNKLGGTGNGNGNFSGASTTIDKLPPAVSSITPSVLSPTNAGSIVFTVAFSENVTGVGSGDFALSQLGGVSGALITGVTGSGQSYDVTVTTGSGSGTLQLNLTDDDSILDVATNRLGGTGLGNGSFNGPVLTIDKVAPTVSTFARVGPSPTNAASVSFTLTFSEPVSALTSGNFQLVEATGATFTSVTGGPASWTVLVNTGTGDGSIQLNLLDNDTIVDTAGNPLNGVGLATIAGPSVLVDKSVPVVQSIVLVGPNPTNAAAVNYTVTFSENVTGVGTADFTVTPTGVSGASVSGVAGSNAVYTVTVNTGSGSGSLVLNLVDDDSIIDIVGNKLGGTGAGNGNFSSASTSTDKVPPTVSSITTAVVSPTNAGSVVFSVTFSEAVTGVDGTDFVVAQASGVSGAAVSSVTGSGTAYLVTVNTGLGSGTIQLNLADDDTIIDAVTNPLGGAPAGNANFNGPTVTIDKVAPTVFTFARVGPTPTNAASVSFTLTFSEPVSALTSGNFQLVQATGASFTSVTGGPTSWTVLVNTGTGDGSIQLNLLDNDTIVDPAGNPLNGSGLATISGPSVLIDKSVPVVQSIVLVGPSPTNAAAVNYTVTFSENVTGVDTSDFTVTPSVVTGASVSGISGSGTTYTVTVNTGSGSGSVRLNLVDNDSIIDLVGNPLAGPGAGNGNLSSALTAIDKLVPTVSSITTAVVSPTKAGSVAFSVTFSEDVTGVDATDFVVAQASGVTGAAVSSVTGSGTGYLVTVNTGVGSGTIQLNLADDDTIIDVATNPLGGAPAGNANFTGPTVTIDRTPPTLSPIVRVGPSPTNAGSVAFTVTFSEPVSGVDTSDFAVVAAPGMTGVTVASVSGSLSSYTVTVNTGSGDGTIQLNLSDDDTIVDPAGNPLGGVGLGTLPGDSVLIDKSVPSVQSIALVGPNPTNAAAVNYTVTFSESVTGVGTADFSVTSGLVGAGVSGVSGTGTTYTVTVNTGSGSGSIVLNLVDDDSIIDGVGNKLGGTGAGNGNLSSAATTIDKSVPLVASITPSSSSTNATSMTFAVTFSEAVTGVDATDFALVQGPGVTGASITGVSGSGTAYLVTVNTGSGSGTLQVNLTDDDSIIDVATNPLGGTPAGNANFAGTAATIDKTSPSVQSITLLDPATTSLGFVRFEVTFSEPVSGVDSGDFALIASGPTGTSIFSVIGSGTTYIVKVDSGSGDGTLRLDVVDNDSIVDPVGNILGGLGAGNGNYTGLLSYLIDKSFPTVVSITSVTSTPTNAATLNFTVQFSESVTGVDASDFSLATTLLTGAGVTGVSGAGSTWTVTVNTGTGDGTVQLKLVDDDSIVDVVNHPLGGSGAGNGNSNGGVFTIDKTVPVASSIALVGTSPINTPSVSFLVTFTEGVTGADTGDFTLTTSGLTGASITSVTGSGATRTVTLNTGTGTGTLKLNLVDDDSIVDPAGNALNGTGLGNGNASSAVIDIDKTPPAVSSISRLDASPTNALSVQFAVAFSESVSGVDASDFSLVQVGVTGASITSVTGSLAAYTVTVSTGSGDGSIRLDLLDDDTIADAAGNKLGGSGNGNGNYTIGASYTLDRTPPTVQSFTRAGGTPTNAASLTYTLTFSENVSGVIASKFSVISTGLTGPGITSITGGPKIWTVAVGTGTGDGSLQLDLLDDDTIKDPAGNSLGGTGAGNGGASSPSTTIDRTPPVVSGISRAAASPTAASSVTFTVTFSESVTGVDATDFGVVSTGLTSAAITSVTGSGTTWTVTVGTGTGSGTLGLDLVDDDSIKDGAGNALGGPNPGNGNFTGEVYTIDRTAPVVLSLNRASGSPTNATTVGFLVTFSKSVTLVATSDFALATTGLTGTSLTGISGSGTTWTVTANTGSGDGSLGLNLVDVDSIQDSLGNKLGGTGSGNGNFAGQVYAVDKSAPAVASIAILDASPTNVGSVHFKVDFSESVTGVDASDFAVAAVGVSGATVTSVTGSGLTYTVTVGTGSGDGTIKLNVVDDDSIADGAGTLLGGTGTGNGNFSGLTSYTIDKTGPTVLTMTRAGATPTNAGTVAYTVTFSESVTGVDVLDFSLVSAGVSSASVATVTGSGSTYTVSVDTGTGDGTIQLALAGSPSINDSVGNGLTAPFPSGEVYTIDKTPPSLAIGGPSLTTTTAGPVSYPVTYTGASTITLSSGDVTLIATGTATGAVGISGAGSTSRTVTITGISGNGTLAISIAANTASDLAGNAAPAAPASAGFTVNNSGTIDLPTLLQVESLTNPTSVGRVPNFSAQYNWNGPVPSDATAFRIQVSTTPAFSSITTWDSPSIGTAFPGLALLAAGARSPGIRFGLGGNLATVDPVLRWNTQYFWRVEFKDAQGDASGFSTEGASFRMAIPSTTASAHANGSQTVAGYRYLGFPIAVGTSVPSLQLLNQTAGGYKWDEPSRNWVLMTGFDVIEGGRGYIMWTNPGAPLSLSMGTVAQGDQAMNFSYTVLPAAAGAEIVENQPANAFVGSHFLTNPFNAPISWDDIADGGQVEKPNVLATYRKYDGTQYVLYNSVSHSGSAGPTLYPFQAFGINLASDNGSAADIVIHEPPAASFVSSKAVPSSVAVGPNNWALNIVASSGVGLDSENIVGVNPMAKDEWDARDAEEPGHGADTWVLLYFSHNDWALHPRDYTHDFRKTRLNAGDEIVWTGTLKTNSGAAVTLTWPNLSEMPRSDWQYFIVDPAAGTSVDMATASSIQIDAAAGPATVLIRAVRLTNARGTLGLAATPGGPAPSSVAPGTSTVPLVAFDVVAAGETITLHKLVVHHEGTGDPSKVLVSLYSGTTRIAGPSSFDGGASIQWAGLGQVLASGAAQTWGIVYDFAPDSTGTYRAALYAGEAEGLGNSSGLTISPAPTLLESSEVTVTTDPGLSLAAGGSSSAGGGGGGSCGLLGVEFIGIAALLLAKRRVGGRRRVSA